MIIFLSGEKLPEAKIILVGQYLSLISNSGSQIIYLRSETNDLILFT